MRRVGSVLGGVVVRNNRCSRRRIRGRLHYSIKLLLHPPMMVNTVQTVHGGWRIGMRLATKPHYHSSHFHHCPIPLRDRLYDKCHTAVPVLDVRE